MDAASLMPLNVLPLLQEPFQGSTSLLVVIVQQILPAGDLDNTEKQQSGTARVPLRWNPPQVFLQVVVGFKRSFPHAV